jgi:hypothetical protein
MAWAVFVGDRAKCLRLSGLAKDVQKYAVVLDRWISALAVPRTIDRP